MRVLGFTCGRWVQLGAPRVLFGVVRLISERPWGHLVHLGDRGCHWVHSGLLSSFGCALGDVGFIRGRYVRSCAPWWSLGSLWVVGIVWVLPGGRWVHSGSLVSFGCNVGYLGSFEVVGLVWVQPGGRWVHSSRLGSSKFALGVSSCVWGCWVHSGASLAVVEFIGVCLVRSGTHWLSLASFGVVGFVRVCI